MGVTEMQLRELLRLAGSEETVVASLRPDVPLLRQGVDSLDFPSFVAVLEERFGLTIPEAEAWELRTLDDFVAYLNKQAGMA